jgi:hypothetical protein
MLQVIDHKLVNDITSTYVISYVRPPSLASQYRKALRQYHVRRRISGTAASSRPATSHRGVAFVTTEVAISEEIPAGHCSFNSRGG